MCLREYLEQLFAPEEGRTFMVSEPRTNVPTRPVLFIGCAGWSIPAIVGNRFPEGNSHLERYAQRFNSVEINSSFYRSHLPATYRRWAATVPEAFRFAVKMPRSISHQARLRDCEPALHTFLDQVGELGAKLGCLLLQLPPSLAYAPAEVLKFFDLLARLHQGRVVCEPRHTSWFHATVDRALRERGIARAGADPTRHLRATIPAGDPHLQYLRLHGSPRIYYDSYSESMLHRIECWLCRPSSQCLQRWCIFDNTALGHATANGLALIKYIQSASAVN